VTWPTHSDPPKIFYKKDKSIKRQKMPRRKKKRKKFTSSTEKPSTPSIGREFF
jgi:hypothetical protein